MTQLLKTLGLYSAMLFGGLTAQAQETPTAVQQQVLLQTANEISRQLPPTYTQIHMNIGMDPQTSEVVKDSSALQLYIAEINVAVPNLGNTAFSGNVYFLDKDANGIVSKNDQLKVDGTWSDIDGVRPRRVQSLLYNGMLFVPGNIDELNSLTKQLEDN